MGLCVHTFSSSYHFHLSSVEPVVSCILYPPVQSCVHTSSFLLNDRPPKHLGALNILYHICELRSAFSGQVPGRRFRVDVEYKWQNKAEPKRNDFGPRVPTRQPNLPALPAQATMGMGVIDLLAAFLIFCLASSVSLLIHVPLLGALVRFRANYTPKGLQIGEEGGVTPHVGPVVPTYLAMLLRIKRIEVSVVSSHGSRAAARAYYYSERLTRLLHSRAGLVYGRGSVRFSSHSVMVSLNSPSYHSAILLCCKPHTALRDYLDGNDHDGYWEYLYRSYSKYPRHCNLRTLSYGLYRPNDRNYQSVCGPPRTSHYTHTFTHQMTSQCNYNPPKTPLVRAAALPADPPHAHRILQAMEDLPRARSHPRPDDSRPLARHRPTHRPQRAPPRTDNNRNWYRCWYR